MLRQVAVASLLHASGPKVAVDVASGAIGGRRGGSGRLRVVPFQRFRERSAVRRLGQDGTGSARNFRRDPLVVVVIAMLTVARRAPLLAERVAAVQGRRAVTRHLSSGRTTSSRRRRRRPVAVGEVSRRSVVVGVDQVDALAVLGLVVVVVRLRMHNAMLQRMRMVVLLLHVVLVLQRRIGQTVLVLRRHPLPAQRHPRHFLLDQFALQGVEMIADHVLGLRAQLVGRQFGASGGCRRGARHRRPGRHLHLRLDAAAESPLRFGHGRDGGELAAHAVVAEGALDDPSRVVGSRVTAIFAFQQLDLLVQKILR